MSIGKLGVQAPFSIIPPLLALLAFFPACAGGTSPGSKGSGGSNDEATGGASGSAGEDDANGAGGEGDGSGGSVGSDGPEGSGGGAGESGAGSGGVSGDGSAGTGGGTGGGTAPVLGCEDCAKYDRCCLAQQAADGGTAQGCMLTGTCNMSPAGITRDFLALGCRTQLQQIAAQADAPAACK